MKISSIWFTKFMMNQNLIIIYLENLEDEYGFDDKDDHVSTFNEFLILIRKMIMFSTNNINCDNIIFHVHTLEVDEFNNRLLDSMERNSVIYNFAVLGMIEYVYKDISTIIKK